jgi:hypothetical protein
MMGKGILRLESLPKDESKLSLKEYVKLKQDAKLAKLKPKEYAKLKQDEKLAKDFDKV